MAPESPRPGVAPAAPPGSDELVDQVLEHLLATAAGPRLALLEGVGLEFLEPDLPTLDLGPDPGIEAAVALAPEGLPTSVLEDRAGDLEATSKGIHPADVGVEKIDRLSNRDLRICLRGDFILDTHGRPIDADFLRGVMPTGNGTSGGTFDSWLITKR